MRQQQRGVRMIAWPEGVYPEEERLLSSPSRNSTIQYSRRTDINDTVLCGRFLAAAESCLLVSPSLSAVKMERVWQRMVGAQSEQDEREASRIVHRVKGRWFNESKNRFPWEGCLSRKDRKHTLGCTFSLIQVMVDKLRHDIPAHYDTVHTMAKQKILLEHAMFSCLYANG